MATAGNGHGQESAGGPGNFWVKTFGDHFHHGYYENHPQLDSNGVLNEDSLATVARVASVSRLIDRLLLWANIPDAGGDGPQKILDVGMGLGAVSRYFGQKFPHASVQGIDVSEALVEDATDLTTASQNLSDKVSFLVADARQLHFPDNEYDLVCCLECVELIPEQEQVVMELVRVTAPGGRIVLTTMCHRELLPHETSLSESEKEALEDICFDEDVVQQWSPPSLYLKLAQEHGLQAIQSDNWTTHVTPGVPIWIHFYKNFAFAQIREFYSKAFLALLNAYEQGLIEYFVLTAIKPSS